MGETLNYTVYFLNSGEIESVCSDRSSGVNEEAMARSGFGICWEIGDPETQYVVEGELVPRPTIPNPDLIIIEADEVSTVADVPHGTKLLVNDELMGSIDDGVFEFTSPFPGTHHIRLEPPFPFVPLAYEVTVDAP